MAVVKMKKIVLAASQSERDNVLSLIQSKGYVQLIDVKEEMPGIDELSSFAEQAVVTDTEVDFNRIKFTYDFLKHHDTRKKGLLAKREIITEEEFGRLEEKIDWRSIYDECKNIEESVNVNRNKKSKIVSLIEQYNQWLNLDVSSHELDSLKRAGYFIGSVSKKYDDTIFQELKNVNEDVYIQKILEGKQDINLFILCHMDDKDRVADVLKEYGFAKASLDLSVSPAVFADTHSNDIKELDADMEDLNLKSKSMAQNIADIEKIYDYMANKLEKENSLSKLGRTQKAFLLKGWISENDVKPISELISKNFTDVYVEFEDPAEEDNPPVVLKNNTFIEPFEFITSMYALPQYKEVDPTPVLTPFYLLFFGMMAGDIGYGVVLLIATAFALKFMDIEGDGRKLVKVLFYVSFPTIFFGWVFGGFFGNALPVTPLWVNPLDEPMTVLYVSIALGLVHLFTGLGVKAYWLIKNGKLIDAVYDVLTWYVLITGLILLLLVGGTVPKIMSIAGALGIFLTQGRANASLSGKIFGGIYGLYGVTSYIGDLLSYSRLLALGLASSLIGASFNLLINLLGGGVVALILGPIIFIGGHTFNLLIGFLGTFVHTCRLEYLEFFGKFYEGGGKAFNPLKIKTKFVRVNTER